MNGPEMTVLHRKGKFVFIPSVAGGENARPYS